MSKSLPLLPAFLFLLALVAGVAGGSLAWNLWSAWRGGDLEAFRAIAGGFSGAFFAFVFVRLGESLKQLYDRQVANHDALVRLDHYLNSCLEDLTINVGVIDNMQVILADPMLRNSTIPVCPARFRLFQVDKKLPLTLTNTDYINEIYAFNALLERVNMDLGAIQQDMQEIKEQFFAKALNEAEYKSNLAVFRDRTQAQVTPFLLQRRGDVVRLIAISRILHEQRPLWSRITQKIIRTSYPKNFSARLASAEKAVLREIDQCMGDSRQLTVTLRQSK
jgi:hypothetical protein